MLQPNLLICFQKFVNRIFVLKLPNEVVYGSVNQSHRVTDSISKCTLQWGWSEKAHTGMPEVQGWQSLILQIVVNTVFNSLITREVVNNRYESLQGSLFLIPSKNWIDCLTLEQFMNLKADKDPFHFPSSSSSKFPQFSAPVIDRPFFRDFVISYPRDKILH